MAFRGRTSPGGGEEVSQQGGAFTHTYRLLVDMHGTERRYEEVAGLSFVDRLRGGAIPVRCFGPVLFASHRGLAIFAGPWS